jgi:ABC-type sugar transport system substrate-binding protein
MSWLPIKLVLSAAALAVLLATPAEAAKSGKHRTHIGAKHKVAKPRVKPVAVRPPQSNDVYFQGHYLGSDPDPRIRYELGRDLGKHFGGDD